MCRVRKLDGAWAWAWAPVSLLRNVCVRVCVRACVCACRYVEAVYTKYGAWSVEYAKLKLVGTRCLPLVHSLLSHACVHVGCVARGVGLHMRVFPAPIGVSMYTFSTL